MSRTWSRLGIIVRSRHTSATSLNRKILVVRIFRTEEDTALVFDESIYAGEGQGSELPQDGALDRGQSGRRH